MKTNQLLAAIVLLQALILASVWSGGRVPHESVAQAQLPDPGAQRIAMINELKALNAKMDKLTAFLESGKLQVRPAKVDEDSGS